LHTLYSLRAEDFLHPQSGKRSIRRLKGLTKGASTVKVFVILPDRMHSVTPGLFGNRINNCGNGRA